MLDPMADQIEKPVSGGAAGKRELRERLTRRLDDVNARALQKLLVAQAKSFVAFVSGLTRGRILSLRRSRRIRLRSS